jgi:hypothetical protein
VQFSIINDSTPTLTHRLCAPLSLVVWDERGASPAEEGPLQSLSQLRSLSQVRRYGWLGVSPSLRPTVWLHCSGADALCAASERTYAQILDDASSALTPEIENQIAIDVPRTFSHCHPRFAEESDDCLLTPLSRVLTAVTFCQESVYWQGCDAMRSCACVLLPNHALFAAFSFVGSRPAPNVVVIVYPHAPLPVCPLAL